MTEPTGNSEEPKQEPLEIEEGSMAVTLKDIHVMFYVLLKQSQRLKPGSKMSFDLRSFKNLPKELKINFERKHGRLFVWIPGEPSDQKKKSSLYLPNHDIVHPN